MMRTLLATTTATAATALLTLSPLPLSAQEVTYEYGERNTDLEPAFDAQFRAELVNSGVELTTETVAGDLVHPWGLAVLPDDAGYLVTERPGRLRHVAGDGTLGEPITGLPEVLAQEQGGLLDVALAPDFAESRRIYWTYAKPLDGGLTATAAAYGRLSDDMTAVNEVNEFFVQEPAVRAPMHYGSRVVFDGAGHVFVTTGEHFTQENRQLAQDLGTTFGKNVRFTMDGEVPEDNPFVGDDSALDSIWSYGHRNTQGAFWSEGALWVVEHGPKGGDELNKVTPGANYGWPVISYGEQYSGGPVGSGDAAQEGMEQPDYFWDPVIAPAGTIRYDGEMFSDWSGDLLISSLYPGGVVRLDLEGETVVAEERLLRDIGRVRDIETDTDGSLLIITDFENGSLMRVSAATE